MGVEQDVRELRAGVLRIERDGCGHKLMHEQEQRDLWKALKEEREAREKAIVREQVAREGLFMKIVIGVLVVVAAGVILNIYSTSAIVEKILSQAYAHPAAAVVQPRK